MSKVNEVFAGFAEKLPFLQEFFKRNLHIAGFELNMLFLIAVAFVALLIIIVIVAIAKRNASVQENTAESERISEGHYILGETSTEEQPKEDIAENAVMASKEAINQEAKSFAENEFAENITEKQNPINIQTVKKPKKVVEKVKPIIFEPEKVEIELVNVEPLKEAKKGIGKYEIFLNMDGYHFYLVANNGQLLYESTGFTTPVGVLKGIETFKKAVMVGKFIIDQDKFHRFRFILSKRYAGENYNTKAACESSIESVKYFYEMANIMPYVYDEEAEKAYEKSKKENFMVAIDWKEIEKEELAAKPSGKYEIHRTADGYHFYLLANNGQLLFSSSGYASLDTVKVGLKNFKKAVYLANFIIDKDKFGRFRFVLRGTSSISTYIGESYTTKLACEKIIESTKRFNKSATIVAYNKEEDK